MILVQSPIVWLKGRQCNSPKVLLAVRRSGHHLLIAVVASLLIVGVAAQQLTPHLIEDISARADHSIALTISGNVPTMFKPLFDIYVLENSSNLRDWSRLPMLVRTNANTNNLAFIDADSNSAVRFYRLYTNSLITPFPKPSGPYTVGTFSRLVTDPSRTNRYSIKTNSSFMVQFWYPAEPTIRLLPGPWVTTAMAQDVAQALMSFYGVSRDITPLVEQALPAAPVSLGVERFPILIYSHEQSGTRSDLTDKIEELVSHGYIAIGIDFAHVRISQFPDGRVVRGGSAFATGMFANDLKDIAFILDLLPSLDRDDPILANRLDLDRIGTFGWSYGGGVAAEACRIDSRVKVAVLLDGVLPLAPELKKQGLQKPFLAMNGTITSGDAGWLTDTVAMFNLSSVDAYQLQIRDADSLQFTFFPWLITGSAYRRNAFAASQCLLAFCDFFLKGHQDRPLRELLLAFPEVINLKAK